MNPRLFFLILLVFGYPFSAGKILGRTESAPKVALSSKYFIGLFSYLAERGYLAKNNVHIADSSVEVYYRREATSPEIGNTIDIQIAIPRWAIEIGLRKADYYIEETGLACRNKSFAVSYCGLLRVHPTGDQWTKTRIDLRQITTGPSKTLSRPLPADVKEALLREVLNIAIGTIDVQRYRFSLLSPYENKIWVFDPLESKLYEITCGGDLDSAVHPLLRIETYAVSKFDFLGSAIRREQFLDDAPMVFGFWACFSDK